jgi:HD-GYP domain-containing protein (c-di-GMP phosphodiesterase class II)
MFAKTYERQVARLQRLQEISAILNSSLNPVEIRRKVVEAVIVLMESDTGSLLLLDKVTQELYFDVALGEKGNKVKDVRLALGEGISGYVAKTGKPLIVNSVQNDSRFSKKADQQTGFLTRNVICVPVFAKDKLLGVLEAVNKKEDDLFDDEDLHILTGLGNQVGIAIENASLYTEINDLFEGFIRASITAIESRDPTTSGHSERVADLTCTLAKVVDRTDYGPYRKTTFGPDQMRELRYAALLHDIGKVSVHEHLLTKAEKLTPCDLTLLKTRFDYILRTLEWETANKKLALIQSGGTSSQLIQVDEELKGKLEETKAIFASILKCNHPTILPEGEFKWLADLATKHYDHFGEPMPYLTPKEVTTLSLPKGTLTREERREIEGHVMHTYYFLSMIPWTEPLRNVPKIAVGHHEKLDGSGYPYQLRGDEIPTQARMMTICDIYDALTASDRPYKTAVPISRALKILGDEAREGKIDDDLLQIFLESKTYLRLQRAS